MLVNMVSFLVLSVSFLVFSGCILGDILKESDREFTRLFISDFLINIFFGIGLLIAATLLSRDLGRMQEKEKDEYNKIMNAPIPKLRGEYNNDEKT